MSRVGLLAGGQGTALPAQESCPSIIKPCVICHTYLEPQTLRFMGMELATGGSFGTGSTSGANSYQDSTQGYVQERNLHRKGGPEGDFFVTKQENVEGRGVVWPIPPPSPPPRDHSH